MNYFPFYPCPVASAKALDDKRLRRVFQEACMMRSNVQLALGESGPYKKVPLPNALQDWLGLRDNLEEPNAVKARQWIYDWTHHLAVECLYRFDGASSRETMDRFCALAVKTTRDDIAGLAFVNLARSAAKGLDYTHIDDVHLAYRTYVAEQWANHDTRPVTWTRGSPPVWYER